MADPALDIRGLGHAFGAVPVLEGVDLAVEPGEVVAVLGPSGSGKTTLLRAIAGLLVPDRGAIAIAGRTVVAGGRERVPPEERGVGLVFQDYALFPNLTVRENVAFGVPRAERDRVQPLLERTGLAPLAERRPAELSGGEQQRAALARALAPGPRIVLLDEPFANVDANRRELLAGDLGAWIRAQGLSALFVTHDREEALGLADRVAVLLPCPEGGRACVRALDRPEVVYASPPSRAVADFVGPASFVAGTGQGDCAVTPLGKLVLARPTEGALEVLLRPEDARFVLDPEGDTTVRARLYRGRVARLTCETPAGVLVVEASAGEEPRPGDRGRIVVADGRWPLAGEARTGPEPD